MANEIEQTGTSRVPGRPVPPGPGAGPPPPPPPGQGPPPPPPGPPPALIRDVWPWLALFGVLVVAGVLIWLFAFRGHHHQPIVPGVVGMTRQQAILRLNRHGYSVTAILGPSSKPGGVVISQKPGGGSRLPKGKRVTIHVSNGKPVAVTTTSAVTTTTQTTTPTTSAGVPNVIGQPMSTGAGQVEAAGFVAETDPARASQPSGQIIRETPTGQAPAGSTVRLTVATGANEPQRSVPSVVGRKAADARSALIAAKFTVRTLYRSGPKKDAGVVVAQSPSGGKAPAYSQVALTVGR